MRRIALALLATAALTQLASAADLPAKAPMYTKAPIAVAYNWSGFYLGINAGGTWAKDQLYATAADGGTAAFWTPCNTAGACPNTFGSGSTSGSGEFGGQLGYNWQMQNLVFGLETDIQWTKASSDASIATLVPPFVAFNGSASSQLKWFGTTRARMGFLVSPTWLLYGTAGVAYGSISRSFSAAFPATAQIVNGSANQSSWGWTIGAGTEWMLTANWILGAEYLYIRFTNNSAFGATGFGSAGCTAANCNFNITSSGLSANVARLRLSYKF